MVKNALKTVLISAISCCGLVSHAAPSNTILGGIELDVTPLEGYVQKMRSSCKSIEMKGAAAVIPTQCYKLPGSFVLLLSDPKDPQKKIVSASIFYQKDFDNAVFTKYLESLKKKYGTPVASSIPFVGDKNIRWEHNGLVIAITEPHMDSNGNVTYITERMANLIRETEEKEKQTEQNSIDSML